MDSKVHGIENLLNCPVIYSTLTNATLFVEIALPFLMWFRTARPYAVAMGIGLHLWIMIAMTIPVFEFLMVTTYIAFYSEEECEGTKEWLKARLGHTRAWRLAEQVPGQLLAARWFQRLAAKRAS